MHLHGPACGPRSRRAVGVGDVTKFLDEPPRNALIAMKPNGSGKHVVVGGRFGKRHFPNKVGWGTHP